MCKTWQVTDKANPVVIQTASVLDSGRAGMGTMGKWNVGDNGHNPGILEWHNPGIFFMEPRAQPEGEILQESSKSMEEAQHECRLARTNTEPSPGNYVMGMGVGRG